MARLKIAIHVDSFRQPLKKALQLAARTGATGVQISLRGELAPHQLSDTARREIRRVLEGLGLVVAAVALPTRRGYNVEEASEERVAGTKRALTLSYELRAPIVVNHIGPIAAEADDPGRQLQVESLSDIARFGERVGAVFAATTGADPPERLRELLESIGGMTLAVNFDPAALIEGGHDPIAAVRTLGPWIVHTQARDAVRLAGERGSREVPLGRGELDWSEYLGALEEFNYRGWFTIRRDEGDDPAADITRAVQFLNSL